MAPLRSPRRAASGIIRAYSHKDREAIRDICRKTAFRNRGSHSVFEDDEVFADYWTSYYTDFEPDSALVVEEDGKIVGYLLGCTDAKRFHDIMGRKIVPLVLARMLFRLAIGRYKQPSTRRMIFWFLFYAWREAPKQPQDSFPAHYHSNILRKGHGKGYYTAMAIRFLDRLRELGIRGIDGHITEATDGGPWTGMGEDYAHNHLISYYAEAPSSFHRYVLGEDRRAVNRVWGIETEPFRNFLVWMRENRRL